MISSIVRVSFWKMSRKILKLFLSFESEQAEISFSHVTWGRDIGLARQLTLKPLSGTSSFIFHLFKASLTHSQKKKDLSTEWKWRYGNRHQIKLIVPEHRGQTCQSGYITSNDWDVCLDEVCVWFGQALLLELMVSCSCRATNWHLQPVSNWPRNSQSQRSFALKCDYFCKVTGKLRIVHDKERLQLKYCKTALKWYSSSGQFLPVVLVFGLWFKPQFSQLCTISALASSSAAYHFLFPLRIHMTPIWTRSAVQPDPSTDCPLFWESLSGRGTGTKIHYIALCVIAWC